MVEIKQNLSNRNNYGANRDLGSIQYIVIHYTANDGDHDESNANYFHNNQVGASAHYFVDDDSITCSVPDNYIAYSVGGSKWSDAVTTGGGKMYGTINNANSISIEMCDTVRNGKYDVSPKTRQNTIDLVCRLMAKYHLTIDRVYRHFDVNGKHCPSYFMDENEWSKFKMELDNSFGAYCYQSIQRYLATQKVPEWAEKELNEAKAKGITDGSNPMQLCNRMQTAIMVKRGSK